MNEEQIVNLTNGLVMQGDLAVRSGDLQAAQRAYQKAKDTSRSALAGCNAGYAIACDKLGDVARWSNQFRTAQAQYDEALPIFRELAASEPRHLRDLSLCLSKIGELAMAERDFVKAKTALQEHFSIAERLAASDPTHNEYQRDLAGAHGRLQQLATMKGDSREALRHAEVVHSICEKLVVLDPSNTSWVQDLAGSDFVFANLLARTGDAHRSGPLLKRSIATLLRLEQEGKLNAKGRNLLAQLRSQMRL